jgi:murein DD-endopeptidase MepM/ murein hydrolase activator NlpD
MRTETRRDLRTFGVGVACGFVAGAIVVWLVMAQYGDLLATRAAGQKAGAAPSASRWQDGLGDIDTPVIESAKPARDDGHISADPPAAAEAEVARELRARRLDVPVEGIKRDQLSDTFRDSRNGSRMHEAIDIMAPRNTPVRAVEDGTIARLFNSKAGGITVYQFDPSERFCYYYAHLERYADGLREGDRVRKGQVVGYVGTSGNAPKDTPHLHFAVFRLTAEKHWWEGTPIDPYDILR